MTDDEMQAAIDAAVDKATKGLKDKVSELHSVNKALKDEAQAAKDAAEQAEHDAAEKSNSVEDVRRSYDAKLKKLQDTIDTRDKTLATMLIDNAISTKLGEAGVFPWASEAVSALMKAGAVVKDGQAMVGDVPLADHIATYLGSDAGKNYVAAPANGGAGATGSTAKAVSHDFTRENFSSRMDEWAIMQKSNPDQAKEIAISVGRSDLI
ncbi:hypothetical protein [Sphingobium yanoikuyae]|uniref:hypothetical protein n=1 Tax=Sphingobium yanoikuyae TaxID=13690 RepID=UPI003F028877